MGYVVPHHINGNAVLEPNHNVSFVHNPATGDIIGETYFANATTCNLAVASAKAAAQSWATTPPPKRAAILFKFRDKLERHQAELATLVTKENGKTLDDAKGSVARGIEAVEFYCGLVHQLQGAFSSDVSHQMDCYSIAQPLGVCVGVSPFNFPVMVPIWMMIPAIAYGNTFILKPSEQDPSAPIRLIQWLEESGLPPGVVNVVQGNQATVDCLLHHPDVKAFTAVASTAVAHSIYTKATAQGMRAHTFGGAKNHAVVMPDAPIETVAQALVGAAFGSAGERCMAISVVVTVGESTADALLSALIPRIHAIRVDAGDALGVDMGPLISRLHRQRVCDAIEQGVLEGAELLIDGRTFQHATFPDGFFLGPSLFDGVSESMSIYQNELFGPVLVMIRVPDFEAALSLVNRHQYGNGTAIFTQDPGVARAYVQQVQVGMVGINVPIPVPIASHPFGGWKQSAFGNTKMHGLDGLHFYTRQKTVTCKWSNAMLEHSAFMMPTHR